jgi:hypothetical protein
MILRHDAEKRVFPDQHTSNRALNGQKKQPPRGESNNMNTPCHTYADIQGRTAWIVLQDAEEELESALKTFPKRSAIAITPGRGYFIDVDGVLKAGPVDDGSEVSFNYSQAKNRMEYVGLDWMALRQIAKEVRKWLALPSENRPITHIP